MGRSDVLLDLVRGCTPDDVLLAPQFSVLERRDPAPSRWRWPVVVTEIQRTVPVPFKVRRGMASIGAIKDRLDIEDAAEAGVRALGAEGLEISVRLSRSARRESYERPRRAESEE